MNIQDFADMVNNQIRKHGSFGGDESVEEAINNLTNWQLMCLILDKCEYSFERELEEKYNAN